MTATNANNANVIAGFLASKGLSQAQVAGVLGNLQVESNLSPTATNPREGAIGIAQWEGPRRTALQQFAKSTGGSETNLQTQLGFMWSELQGPESGAYSALQSASTPAAAATAFDQKYERSSASSLPTRVADAQQWFATGLPGNSDGAGQQFGVNTSNAAPGGATAVNAGFDWNPLNWPSDIAGTVGTKLLGALAPIGRVIVSAGVVIFGAVLLIVAVLIIARGAGDNSGGGAPPAPPAPGRPAGKGGAEESAGGEAAEVAEVAAV